MRLVLNKTWNDHVVSAIQFVTGDRGELYPVWARGFRQRNRRTGSSVLR